MYLMAALVVVQLSAAAPTLDQAGAGSHTMSPEAYTEAGSAAPGLVDVVDQLAFRSPATPDAGSPRRDRDRPDLRAAVVPQGVRAALGPAPHASHDIAQADASSGHRTACVPLRL